MIDFGHLEQRNMDVFNRVMDSAIVQGNPLTIVDSPPGAGKTWLVERVISLAVSQAGFNVCCLTPRASQAFDLASRLVENFELKRTQLLMSPHRSVPDGLVDHIDIITHINDVGIGAGVVISTIDKFAAHLSNIMTNQFDLMIIDEAYQAAFKDFIPVSGIAGKILLVGDPGQLAPVIQSDTAAFEGASYRVHWPAPKELLRLYPEIPYFNLVATRRLLQDTVDILQPNLYPDLRFASLAKPSDRRLSFSVASINVGIDRALNMVASGMSIVGIMLPYRAASFEDVDDEIALTMANVVDRFLTRDPQWVEKRRLGPDDIGCIDSRVVSGGALRTHLRVSGHNQVFVNTPEIWQGWEKPVTVVKHPLSNVTSPAQFDIEPGRWCVMLSRHQIGCVIVGRENISSAISEYQHDCGKVACGADDTPWFGFKAHSGIWSQLEREGRLIRIHDS